MPVIVPQEMIVVGVGSIVDYDLTEAVVPRLGSDLITKPCRKHFVFGGTYLLLLSHGLLLAIATHQSEENR